MTSRAYQSLRPIFGDQLSHDLASLRDAAPDKDLILMMEVTKEATYVPHHPKKIALIFSAMRHFADELRDKGFTVDYVKLTDPENTGTFRLEVERAAQRYNVEKIVVTHPGEYRVLKDIQGWSSAFDIDVAIREDDRFLCSMADFKDWAEGRKQLRMEYFYREMRKKHGILMDDDGKPEGGEWNYDKENREKLPEEPDFKIPDPTTFEPDEITTEVLNLVEDQFSDHFGDLRPFPFAVTRREALKVLRDFLDQRLPRFGTYQDAMKEGEPWLFHAHLSFYINLGLLSPREVIERAEEAYHEDSDRIPLNAVEGFIRQILGWREYVRGLYWLKMPDYKSENFLEAKRALPDFYWSGDTKMNCLKQCITETRENAYAHHIQRLMITGNFALLIGADPDQVNEWYLAVYADAYEWVELPNVTGMILFADGGVLASKPYAAGGAYINRMSDYCKNCAYSVTQKTGENACPFNYLYWHFLIENQDKLKGNQRLGMVYNTLDKMDDEKVSAIQESTQAFLKNL